MADAHSDLGNTNANFTDEIAASYDHAATQFDALYLKHNFLFAPPVVPAASDTKPNNELVQSATDLLADLRKIISFPDENTQGEYRINVSEEGSKRVVKDTPQLSRIVRTPQQDYSVTMAPFAIDSLRRGLEAVIQSKGRMMLSPAAMEYLSIVAIDVRSCCEIAERQYAEMDPTIRDRITSKIEDIGIGMHNLADKMMDDNMVNFAAPSSRQRSIV